MNNLIYSKNFFSIHEQKSISSAGEIIPIVIDYVSPSSVIDVGCGNGTWLKVWMELGVKNVLGIDGEYVEKTQLLVEEKYFQAFDIEQEYVSDKKYDLVTSLEVGEHLKPGYAATFIKSLCNLGDVVLFSAAIPGQGGTFHINEQYPDYWAKLFLEQNFVAVDCIREKIWDNDNIEWWYRQNVFIFINRQVLSKYKKLSEEFERHRGKALPFVHPKLLEEKIRLSNHYKSLLVNPLRGLGFLVKKLIRR